MNGKLESLKLLANNNLVSKLDVGVMAGIEVHLGLNGHPAHLQGNKPGKCR